MLFNSIEFIILVLLTMVFYYIPAFSRFQIIILILSSFIFYAYNQPYLLILLVSSALINAITSYLVFYQSKNKLFWAFSGVACNLVILGFFKYNKLFASLIIHDLSKINGIGEILITLPLPIGISFFTFQGISLVADVYRCKKQNQPLPFVIEKNFLVHCLKTVFFISFFPQLVAGPIVKAHEFMPQIGHKLFKNINWEKAFKACVTGYFLKIVIADNLKDLTFWIAYPHFQHFSSLNLITFLFGFSMQIFADFAGYSLIAIGVGALFGYNLPTNFNFPYISKSFSEFWRRWHISLSSWLKEYLYFSLGGSKKGNFRTYLNLFIVMFLGGLWHGAAWSYAVWGTWHGLALAFERPFLKKLVVNNALIKGLQMLFVFSYVTMSWLLFKLTDFSHVCLYVESIFHNLNNRCNLMIIIIILVYSLSVIIYHVQYLVREKYGDDILKPFEYLTFGGMLFLIVFNGGPQSAFIYFQF